MAAQDAGTVKEMGTWFYARNALIWNRSSLIVLGMTSIADAVTLNLIRAEK